MIDWTSIDAGNARLNAFVDFDRLAAFGQGPLERLTIGIKSNIAVAGLPWTAGMALRRDVVATGDADVVGRLRTAGAAIIGSLNMHEAALGATTDNRWFGRTDNPHRAGFTPGGSSGGSGAAVAAELCDAALGTDTLGSVRIPAAYNGVYGLKPTNGAVSHDGLVELDGRFDCIGPLARDLDTLELVWRAMVGEGQDSDVTFGRLVVLAGLGGVEVEPAVAAGYERALAAIDREPDRLALVDGATDIRRAGFIAAGQALIAALGQDRIDRRALLSDELAAMLDYCAGAEPREDVLDRTRASVREAIGDDGVLLMPTAPQAAFAHGRAPANQADFTALANIAGLPALALPSGFSSDKLPVGVQLVGPTHCEAMLFDTARSLDRRLCAYAPPTHQKG